MVARTVDERSLRIEPPDELELSLERPRREDAVGLLDVATRSLDGDVRRAECANDEQRYEDAIAILRDLPSSLVAAAHPSFRVRVVLAESWARMYLGELREAEALAERARAVSEAPACTEIDRAQALYHLGCCRYKLS